MRRLSQLQWSTRGACWIGLSLVGLGCGNITTGQDEKNAAPVAVVPGNVSAITQVPARFDGSGSSDPDGFIVAWEWSFGDGNTATGETVTHIYEQAGNYDVSLVVRDNKQKEAGTSLSASVDALDALAGIWSLDPDTGSALCENSHSSYAVLFPAAALNVSVNGTTISGVANVSGTTLTGEFDVDGSLQLSGSSNDADAICGTATVNETLNADFSDAQNFSGQYVIQFNWTDAFCNCTQIFDVTGTR